MLVYNVHGLVHLASDAQHLGPLDSYSAFPFESFLGRLKKMVRSPNRCLPQVIRRLSEMKCTVKKDNDDVSLGQEHADGPVLIQYKRYSQHQSLKLNRFYLSVLDGDNCVQIGTHYGLIRNIIKNPNDSSELLVMFEQFVTVSDFFQYPLNSSDLGIVKVSKLSDTIRAEKVSDIVCKFYRIPYKESFVVVPLVHQIF